MTATSTDIVEAIPVWVKNAHDLVDEIVERFDVPRPWLVKLSQLVTEYQQGWADEAAGLIEHLGHQLSEALEYLRLDNPLG